jgi:hypothetical protein
MLWQSYVAAFQGGRVVIDPCALPLIIPWNLTPSPCQCTRFSGLNDVDQIGQPPWPFHRDLKARIPFCNHAGGIHDMPPTPQPSLDVTALAL